MAYYSFTYLLNTWKCTQKCYSIRGQGFVLDGWEVPSYAINSLSPGFSHPSIVSCISLCLSESRALLHSEHRPGQFTGLLHYLLRIITEILQPLWNSLARHFDPSLQKFQVFWLHLSFLRPVICSGWCVLRSVRVSSRIWIPTRGFSLLRVLVLVYLVYLVASHVLGVVSRSLV